MFAEAEICAEACTDKVTYDNRCIIIVDVQNGGCIMTRQCKILGNMTSSL